jgi:hypothetical protein
VETVEEYGQEQQAELLLVMDEKEKGQQRK